jgi:hypothetical protein
MAKSRVYPHFLAAIQGLGRRWQLRLLKLLMACMNLCKYLLRNLLTLTRFLLAQLHLDSLIGKRSPKAVRKALEILPSGSKAYDHAYQNAMERIEGQVADQTRTAKEVLS